MTLTTHAIAGAAVAQFFPEHIVVAFILGFISHFILDSIPHWDYTIYSVSQPEEYKEKINTTISTTSSVFLYDLYRIGCDFAFGLFLSLILFSAFTTSPLVTLAGAVGGVFPDPLQFVYWKLRPKIMEPLQKFHIWIQSGKNFKYKPGIGIPFQIAIVILIVVMTYVIKIKLI